MFKKLLYKILDWVSERRLNRKRALKRKKLLEEIKKRDPFVYPQF